jgi:hypothetical protein
VVFGENAFVYLLDNLTFELFRIDILCFARATPLLIQRPADVIGKLATFGISTHQDFAAETAMSQSTEQERTRNAFRMYFYRGSFLHKLLHFKKRLSVDDSRASVFGAYRLITPFTVSTPDKDPGIYLIG